LTPTLTADQHRAVELRAATLALMGTLVYGSNAHQIQLAFYTLHAEALTRALGESDVPEPSRTTEHLGSLAAQRKALGRTANRFALQADSGEFAALFAAIAASVAQIESVVR
jgi:hypothetical protein